MRSGRPSFSEIQRERAEIRDHIERVTDCGRDVASRIATWLHDTGVRGDPTKALLAADPASFAVVQGVGRRSIETIRIFRERARPPKPNDDRALALEALTSTGDPPSEALIAYLRRVHDGTDRGELKALLVEAWGASPASTSDLRGLAAREAG